MYYKEGGFQLSGFIMSSISVIELNKRRNSLGILRLVIEYKAIGLD